MIPAGFIQDLISRLDIVEVVGRHVELRKAGINHKGLCPFHGEKTPSFIVSPSRQTYHCFGCGAHGDALRFVMEFSGLGFVDAVHELAQQAGMAVPEDDSTPQEKAAAAEAKAQQASLGQVLSRAAEHYRKQLKASPRAIDYLKGRGLTGRIAARFGLGYAPEGWRGLASVFPRYDDPLLAESGLVIVQGDEGEDQKRYDRFRDRIMFPIRSVQGEVIGFGGRVLDKGEPKYLNSPETPVFHKGRELYGLHEARQALREKGYGLVVEGYMDVVALAQLGFPNAVATLGTACTAEHVQKLLRFTDSIVFSFDGDAAGRRAAGRALEAALPHASDTRSFRFLFLPPEHDPDSYVRENGPEAFERCVAEAVPLSRQLAEAAREGCDMATAEGRSRFLAQARPLWSALPEGALRGQILADLASDSRTDTQELVRLWANARGPARAAGAERSHDGEAEPPFDADRPQGQDGREGRPWRSHFRSDFRREGSSGRRPGAGAGGRRPLAGVANLLDRVLWLLLWNCELWQHLADPDHDLLAEQAAPYGPAFAWLERHLSDHGPAGASALMQDLAQQDLGPQGGALVQRVSGLLEPEASADLGQELQVLLQRLRLKTIEDELQLLIESGELSPDAQVRAKELYREQADLKMQLAAGA